MCKQKHLIWLFRSSPPTSKIKCYPSFPPYSQTLSLWSLLIHKWVCFKPNHKEKNLISIFWSCFVFFGENPSSHALLFQISRFQFISQFVVQIVDLELKYFTIKKYFVKFYLFSPESELDWKVKWHKFSAHFHTSAYLSISFRNLILLVRVLRYLRLPFTIRSSFIIGPSLISP